MTGSSLSRTLTGFVVLALFGFTLTVAAKLRAPDNDLPPYYPYLQVNANEDSYTVRARNALLKDVLDELARVSGAHFSVDPGLGADRMRVSVKLVDVPLEKVLESLVKSGGLIYEKDGDRFRLTSATLTAKAAPVAMPAGEPGKEAAAPEKPAVRSPEEQAALEARGILTNTRRPARDLRRRGQPTILLANALIDAEVADAEGRSVEPPEALRAPADTEYYIVQFDHVLSQAERAQVEAAGATISHYVPNSAYAIHVSPDHLAAVKALPGAGHVEPYHPYYKLSRDILQYMRGQPDEQARDRMESGHYNVMLFRGAKGVAVLQRPDVSVVRQVSTDGREIWSIDTTPDVLEELISKDVVQWVEPRVERDVMNDTGQRRTHVTRLKSLHPKLNGSNVIVAVTDSGVDFTHAGYAQNPALPTSTGLNTRIVYYDYRTGGFTADGLPGDNNGHGSHVAGTILGNGAHSDTANLVPGSDGPPYSAFQFAGAAPKSKLVMLEDFNSFSDEEQASISYQKGARISNNSWGNTLFQYGTLSAIWDALVRDARPSVAGNQQFTAIFAAGNSGGGGYEGVGASANTVGEPGNAKNVISVGAVEQRRHAENYIFANYRSEWETDSDWEIASFSSRGPVTASDPRVKPDIVAPGVYTLSIQSQQVHWDDFLDPNDPRRDLRLNNVDTGTNYAFLAGTSMATPLVTGGAALLYQYYTNTYGRVPSPAMLKAMLVNGARMVNSLVYRYAPLGAEPSIVDQGWGLMDVVRSVDGESIHPTDSLLLLDQLDTTPLETTEIYSEQIEVKAGEGGLKITLAWTDPAGTPGNAFQLVNDIDLVVLAPGGQGYLGNFFAEDQIHSEAIDGLDSEFVDTYGDGFNNVENVIIADAPKGVYTIQVYGHSVPQGPQDFALSIMKGIGIQGRTAGRAHDMDLDADGNPVIVYEAVDSGGVIAGGNTQVFLKAWSGEVGTKDEIGRWERLEDQWFSVRGSAELTGVSRSLNYSGDPAVAVDSNKLHVAWVDYGIVTTGANTRIHYRQYNGTDWIELNNSAKNFGISAVTLNASEPEVEVGTNGNPIVSWKQAELLNTKVYVTYHNGTNWVGFANSHTSGVPGGVFVGKHDLAANRMGWVAVAWEEFDTQRIRIRRWNPGTGSWQDLGQQGSAPFALEPDLDLTDNGDVYLAWKQLASLSGTQLYAQVYASRFTGGSWQSIDGSTAYPGVSGIIKTDRDPRSPQIDVAFNGFVTVAWHSGGTNNPNGVLLRRFDGSDWSAVSRAGTFPGLARLEGESRNVMMKVDGAGVPVVSFENDESVTNEVAAYKLIADRDPPLFDGLGNAVGGTSMDVELSWNPATDLSTTIVYTIYQGSSSVPCGTDPNCDPNDVFANPIAMVNNATNFTVNGLTPNFVYCFGVRAADTNGLMELNDVIRAAGPVTGAGDNDGDCLINGLELAAGTEPCLQDTDGDGMWDGWEVAFSTFSTNHPSYTNASLPHLDALDNGIDQVRTLAPNDGDPAQLPDNDLDNDGVSSIEEFQWWLTHTFTNGCDADPFNRGGPDPTVADTDGDGMDDGYEIDNDLIPDFDDSGLDPDMDGLINGDEARSGSNPNNPDSDADGLYDGFFTTNNFFVLNFGATSNDFEGTHGTSPSQADTDHDGLSDSFEVDIGSNPIDADSGNTFLGDGDVYQLGFDDFSAVTNFCLLINEDFETGSVSNWTHYVLNAALFYDLWHVTATEPDPATNVVASSVATSIVTLLNQHTTSLAYRVADDLLTSPGTNLLATYNKGSVLGMALESPPTNATHVGTLFLAWNEYYVTEPNADFVEVQARSDFSPNWTIVSTARSGKSGVLDPNTNSPARWTRRVADMSQYAGKSNVQVRFVFTALNSIDNDFPGWWVDDVQLYEGAVVTGWVRNVNGAPVEAAQVFALGRGGVTNIVDGHRVVPPGKIIAETMTAPDGSYRLIGLPLGRYFIKASSPQYRDEFFNGQLYTPPYAFGQSLNPGVYSVSDVTNGWLDLRAKGSEANCDFELEPGRSRSCLGVSLSNGNGDHYPVFVNGCPATVWNGSNTFASAAFPSYLTSDTAGLTNNNPDWIDNPVMPSLLCDLPPGAHYPVAGTNLNFYPLPEVITREGEITLIDIYTNQAKGSMEVRAADGIAYDIEIDNRVSGEQTPALIAIEAGRHKVRLLATNNVQIGFKTAVVPLARRVQVTFSTNDTMAAPGAIRIDAVDIQGNAVTGATIMVNHRTNDIPTPALITGLRPGVHAMVVKKPGYRMSDYRKITIKSSVTNTHTFLLYQADEDYDAVGDATEILGYTNITLFTRTDDPDGDTLNNLFEFDQFRLFNVILNPFDADSDDDLMSDGAEVDYDGVTNLLALSVLDTNAIALSDTVRSLFVGRFLEGVDHFTRVAAAECDRFAGTNTTHTSPVVPTKVKAVTIFQGIPAAGESVRVSTGHPQGAEVLADGIPDRPDTDGDGMWDGFEAMYGTSTVAKLDVIECGRTTEDPDHDGLSNLDEFLGVDGVACDLAKRSDGIDNDGDAIIDEEDECFDSTDPTKGDTDGDGMPDGFEFTYGLNPINAADAFEDPDGDGLINLSEYLAGSNPRLADTDADGLPDAMEVIVFNTNPQDEDTDDDGLLDGREVWDKDLDGIPDGGFFPNWAGGDLDNDGLVDGPTDWDTDGDGMPDGFEVIDAFGNIRNPALDPYDPTDGDEDPDGDGLTSLQEFLVRDALFGNPPTDFPDFALIWDLDNLPVWDYSTDPFNPDSDGDGMPDGFEVLYGLHPMDPIPVDDDSALIRYRQLGNDRDLDRDGLWNISEFEVRFAIDPGADPVSAVGASTHPWYTDTDNDGLADGEEYHEFRSNPVIQDTDGDRLFDGSAVEGIPGEVASKRLTNDYMLVTAPPGGITWTGALWTALTIPHPSDPTKFGHLVTILNQAEQNRVMTLLSGNETNIAIGGGVNVNSLTVEDEEGGELLLFVVTNGFWWTGESFRYENWAETEPNINPTLLTNAVRVEDTMILYDFGNEIAMTSTGSWFVTSFTNLMDHYIVEWEDIGEDTNHFDRALNDLWQFDTPGPSDAHRRGIWTEVSVNTNSPLPPPRWGHVGVYVPGFEKKVQFPDEADDHLGPGGTILLDNRKYVVMGGTDGVDKKVDVWEYWVKSNYWVQSSVDFVDASPLTDFFSPGLESGFESGVSDFQGVTLMGYDDSRNTLGCDCGSAMQWDCDGIEFGEPKSRPWDNDYQRSSFDQTFIMAGWNDDHRYFQEEPIVSVYYHSTDDENPITEISTDDRDVWEAAQASDPPPTDPEDIPTLVVYENIDPDVSPRTVPLGNYTDVYQVEITNFVHDVHRTNQATAIQFARFPFDADCETLAEVLLILDVAEAPTVTNLELTIQAEYRTAGDPERESHFDYDLNVANAVQPTSRLGNGHYATAPQVITIPMGSTGSNSFDITPIATEIALQTGPDGVQFNGGRLGFVITGGSNDFATIVEDESRLQVSYFPGYRESATWYGGSTVQTEGGGLPSRRKSVAMAYDSDRDTIVLFGGINGREVLGDTWEGSPTWGGNHQMQEPRLVSWSKVDDPQPPPARWGAAMAYDSVNEQVIMFGGFDANNQPLNDLWAFGPTFSTADVETTNEFGSNVTVQVTITNDASWMKISEFQDTQRPSPRGGAAIAFYGNAFYDRGADDYVAGQYNKMVLFGGTDGKRYYNDTWMLFRSFGNPVIETETGNRWALIDPGGEQSQGPEPRAYASMVWAQNFEGTFATPPPGIRVSANPSMVLFGGRTGLLPTSRDTDYDMVEDGTEYELGGPDAGRDPRRNALVAPDGTETIPFAYKRIGTTGNRQLPPVRGAIADFEVLSYVDRVHGWRAANVYGLTYFPWQGHPIETTLDNQTYIIANELEIPFEDPASNRLVYITGVDALSADWTNLWFHRHGHDTPDDPKDVWQLGVPNADAAGEGAAPPYALSGRWVYGTDLSGPYPNDAVMELYSPIFNLKIPSLDSTSTANSNAFALVFHEWLRLADSNDVVKVELVRPDTPADIANRKSGLTRPDVTLVPPRNNLFNTSGDWRRVIVPLDLAANESNLYVRFTLESDASGVAGGWYLDDVAILQGGEICGTAVGSWVDLKGINPNNNILDTAPTDGNGLYQFGLLPLGSYQVMIDGTNAPVVLGPGGKAQAPDLLPAVMFLGIAINSPPTITWASTPGFNYVVDYSDDLKAGTWSYLTTKLATGTTTSYQDSSPTPWRVYRVTLILP